MFMTNGVVRAITRAMMWAGGTTFFMLLSCGEPLGSLPSGWETKAEIPATYFSFSPRAVGPRGVYVNAQTNEGVWQLLVFDGTEFLTDYETASEEGNITDAVFIGESGFMGVSRRTYPEGCEAVLLQLKDGEWEEILCAPEYQDFSDFHAIGPNAFWLLGKRPDGPYVILKYGNGSLSAVGVAGLRCLTAYSPQTKDYTVYGLGEENTIRITRDYGATWHRETIELPPHYRFVRLVSMAASPDALYLNTRVITADLEYYAIIKRTGPPGDGVYEFSYLGWVGPNVGQIDSCAFRDAADGIAVGLGTTMRYDVPEWLRETSDPFQRWDELLADPRGGYWAVTGRSLVWHP